jgi:transposase
LVRQRTTLILSFKSLNERTLGQRVPLARVKAMKAEEAQARFTDPADQLLSGQQIILMGHLTDSIIKLEQHILGVVGKWSTYQRLQELPGIGKILGLTIALETGDAQRFADAGNFASYSRCVKSLRTSNGKKKGGNNPDSSGQPLPGLGPAPAGWKPRTSPAVMTINAAASTTARNNKPIRSLRPSRWPANWPRPRGM